MESKSQIVKYLLKITTLAEKRLSWASVTCTNVRILPKSRTYIKGFIVISSFLDLPRQQALERIYLKGSCLPYQYSADVYWFLIDNEYGHWEHDTKVQCEILYFKYRNSVPKEIWHNIPEEVYIY
jgi:hypothetical protein